MSIYALAYVAIVLGVWVMEHYIDWRLHTFDLDGDGVFGDSEQIGEFEYFFEISAKDTARTFIPFTAVIYSGLVVGFAYVLTLVRRGVGRLMRRRLRPS